MHVRSLATILNRDTGYELSEGLTTRGEHTWKTGWSRSSNSTGDSACRGCTTRGLSVHLLCVSLGAGWDLLSANAAIMGCEWGVLKR